MKSVWRLQKFNENKLIFWFRFCMFQRPHRHRRSGALESCTSRRARSCASERCHKSRSCSRKDEKFAFETDAWTHSTCWLLPTLSSWVKPNKMDVSQKMWLVSFQGNDKVTRLQLDGNMLGDEGAEVVSWLLGEHECHIDTLVSALDITWHSSILFFLFSVSGWQQHRKSRVWRHRADVTKEPSSHTSELVRLDRSKQ